MDTKRFFKALIACTAKDRNPLQFIYQHAETEETETLVATNGHIVTVAVVSKFDIEKAIQQDIIVRKGVFYIDRKRKELPADDIQYPNWEQIIPTMRRVDLSARFAESPRTQFDPALLSTGINLIESFQDMKKGKLPGFKFTHIPYTTTGSIEDGFTDIDEVQGMHAHFERGLFIGIMPLRFRAESDGFGPEKVDQETFFAAIGAEEEKKLPVYKAIQCIDGRTGKKGSFLYSHKVTITETGDTHFYSCSPVFDDLRELYEYVGKNEIVVQDQMVNFSDVPEWKGN